MSTETQNHQEWVERQEARQRIDDEMFALIEGNSFNRVKNESLNVEQRTPKAKDRVRAARPDKMRVM